jgi:hypothetical protein
VKTESLQKLFFDQKSRRLLDFFWINGSSLVFAERRIFSARLYWQLAILSKYHFVYLLFSSTCHFVNLPYQKLDISSSSTWLYTNWSLHQIIILSTCYSIDLPLRPLAMSSTCCFINLLFHQLAISSTCNFINLLFWQLAIPLTCYFINLLFNQLDISSSGHIVN